MQHLGIAFDSEELDEVKYETKILFNILDRVQKENPKLTLNEFEDWTTSKGE
jgi:3-methyladenine DNA glycosylase AlkC